MFLFIFLSPFVLYYMECCV